MLVTLLPWQLIIFNYLREISWKSGKICFAQTNFGKKLPKLLCTTNFATKIPKFIPCQSLSSMGMILAIFINKTGPNTVLAEDFLQNRSPISTLGIVFITCVYSSKLYYCNIICIKPGMHG